jgi:hypothetical protein
MNSQKVAGILGTIIALLVMAGIVIYGPKPGKDVPKPAATTEAPKAPVAPAPRGPVVREVPQ